MAELVIAFAGNGDTSPANVAALLNNWLTDDVDVKEFLVPAKILARKQKGLANVVAYLSEFWGGDDPDTEAFSTMDAGSLVSALAGDRENGFDPYLVVLIGDEDPDDATADLVKEAIDAGITVKDLCAGLDDVTEISDDQTEQAAPEPEQPAVTPTRRRRSAAATEPEKPAESTTGPRPKRPRGTPRAAEAAESDVPTGRRSRRTTGPSVPEDNSDTPPWKTEDPGTAVARATKAGVEASEAVEIAHDLANEALRRIVSEEVRAALTTVLSGGLTALTGPLAESIAFIRAVDGQLRKRGAGRPRTGEEIIWLTEAEAKEKGLLDG